MTQFAAFCQEPCQLSLESQLQRLALEASVVNNVVELFRTTLPAFASKLSEVASSFVNKDEHSEAALAAFQLVDTNKEQINKINFIDHATTLVPVPEGFDGNLLEYLSTLLNMAPAIFVEGNNVIEEYNLVLSNFVTNKDAKTSLKDHTAFYQQVEKNRTAMSDKLAAFFTTKNDRSRLPLGKIFHQTRDIFIAVEKAGHLEKARRTQNLEQFSKNVTKVSNVLNIVLRDSETEDLTNISGSAAMNLSTGALELARYVEFVALFRYRVEQAIVSVQRIAETLSNISKM